MEWRINVGTVLKIKKGFMRGNYQIMYCGMSDENTFVLAPLITVGYQGFSPNIYFNSNSTLIQIQERQFEVYEVTPEYIILGDLNMSPEEYTV